MEKTKRGSRIIETYRMLTEERLLHLLQGAKSHKTLDDVSNLIFEGEATDFRLYLTAMLATFNCTDLDDLDETVLQVIQDAWNYFPHRCLNGRCPAEIMMQNTRKIKS
jgi:hypothetical protein